MSLLPRLWVILFLAVYVPIAFSTLSIRVTGEQPDFYGHHASYRDRKFQNAIHKALNHELYHHREAIPGPAATSTTPSDTPENGILNVSSASPISKHVATPETDMSIWKNQTQVACLRALMAAHDGQPNASGIAPCYNIPSFDNSTGSFTADLRLYTVSTPSDDWASAESQGMSVGISFAGAKFGTPSLRRLTRGLENIPLAMVYETQAITIRDTIVIPRHIRDLSFHGKVTEYTSGGNVDPRVLRLLVKPNITLSGTTRQGISISTQLSLSRACFVNGLFIEPNAPNGSPVSQASAAATASEEIFHASSGTAFKGLQINFIITSVWVVLYTAITGHGVLRRFQARSHYRRRIQRSKSSGFTHN